MERFFESKEESESEDEEIEAMFAESSESERERWVQSVERRGSTVSGE